MSVRMFVAVAMMFAFSAMGQGVGLQFKHFLGTGVVDPGDGGNLFYTEVTQSPQVEFIETGTNYTPDMFGVYRVSYPAYTSSGTPWTYQIPNMYFPTLAPISVTSTVKYVRFYDEMFMDGASLRMAKDTILRITLPSPYSNTITPPVNFPVTAFGVVITDGWGPKFIPLYIPQGTRVAEFYVGVNYLGIYWVQVKSFSQ